MPIFETPELRSDELEVLNLIDGLRNDLRNQVAEPRRWTGTLRRSALNRAVQASNSIEGYNASLDDVAAIAEDEPVLSADEETVLAIAGYRDAMTFVLQIADDNEMSVDQGLLRSLHFMILRHDLSKSPGNWRQGEIFVTREATGEQVYEGPDWETVPSLIGDLVDELHSDPDTPTLVEAAMAHLNLVMIHPFRDGNGRMARCLQTLVLARDRIVAPVFSSIEEFLGRNTEAYYDVLADVGAGSWNPGRSARPWVRFCIRAHYVQARSLLRRNEAIYGLFKLVDEEVQGRGLSDRTTAPLVEAALGSRIRRGSYRELVESGSGEEISDLTASRELRALVEAGLLDAHGERRARYYSASPLLAGFWRAVRAGRPPRSDDDPFALVADRRQLRLVDD